AVGPGVWNNWKAALLRQLYYATEEVLSGGTLHGGRSERVAALHRQLASQLADWSEEERAALFARGNPGYWLSFDIDTLAHHARLIRRAEREALPLVVEPRVDPRRSITELTIHTLDTPGLFARLAGAMAASGATIVDAKAFTMSNGMVLDVFGLQDLEGKAFAGAEKLGRLSQRIEQALSGRLDI